MLMNTFVYWVYVFVLHQYYCFKIYSLRVENIVVTAATKQMFSPIICRLTFSQTTHLTDLRSYCMNAHQCAGNQWVLILF